MARLILVMSLAVLMLPAFSLAQVELEEINGYLCDRSAEESFTVYCDQRNVDIEFSWPEDADFWVRVVGMYGVVLGDFPLSEGEVVRLSGGGRFTLVVHSERGQGAWSAVVQSY